MLKNATTRQILLVSDLGFFAPQHLLFEVRRLTKNRRFRNRLGVKEADLRDLISWIVRPITFVPEEMYVSFIRNALPLVAHHEDAPYIALSLALEAPL